MPIPQTNYDWEWGFVLGSRGTILPQRFKRRWLLVIPLIQRVGQRVPYGLALPRTLNRTLEAELHYLRCQPDDCIGP